MYLYLNKCSSNVGSDDDDVSTEPHAGGATRNRVHTSLVVVLIITVISTLMALGFFFYKKSPRPLPTFDNPLYFGTERSQPDVVDTNKLIENAEAENPEPIIALWFKTPKDLKGMLNTVKCPWCVTLRCFITVFYLLLLVFATCVLCSVI